MSTSGAGDDQPGSSWREDVKQSQKMAQKESFEGERVGMKRSFEEVNERDEHGLTKRIKSEGDDVTGVKKESKAELMMKRMGHKGGGLGKQGQGPAEPLAQSTQISTMGLGYKSDLIAQTHEYKEFAGIEIEIKPVWLFGDSVPPTAETLKIEDWLVIGEKLMESNLNGTYCDVSLQEELNRCKTVFDHVDKRTFLSGRERSNPYEKIGKEMFQNRAALKMAEMDAIFEKLFTQPPCLAKRQLLHFGDICAGPGGFSEFMLTVLKWRARGYGFTIRGQLDFKINQFNPNAPTQSFKAYYGKTKDGDITRNENIQDFASNVWQETRNAGLHVLLGDGGISVEDNWNNQELLCRQLVLCQFITALATLGPGGVFMCKVFDTFQPFTVQLLYLLRLSFLKFCLCKPNQSRPANSERYVVCSGFKHRESAPLLAYLYRVNTRLASLAPGQDVLSLVPADKIDPNFISYIRTFNESNAKRQIMALKRIKKYIEDPSLPPDDQDRIRRESLAFWDISEAQRQDISKLPHRVLENPMGKPQRERKVFYDPKWGNMYFTQSGPSLFTDEGSELFKPIQYEMRHLHRHLCPLPPRGSESQQFKEQLSEMRAWKNWFVYAVPQNGLRWTLLSAQKALYYCDESGKPQQVESSILSCSRPLPSDVILDVVSVKPSRVRALPTESPKCFMP